MMYDIVCARNNHTNSIVTFYSSDSDPEDGKPIALVEVSDECSLIEISYVEPVWAPT